MNTLESLKSSHVSFNGKGSAVPIGRRLRRGLLPILGAISLGLASPAFADRMEVAVSVAAGANRQANSDFASNLSGDPQAFASISAVAPSSSGTQGSASGRAEAGSLGVSIRAASSGGGFTRGDASALFRDSLVVTAPGLALGTPVTLFFDLSPPPSGAIGVCTECFTGFVKADLNLVFGVAIRDRAVTWTQGVTTGSSIYSGSFTSSLARVGDTISIEGTLTAMVAVGAPKGDADYLFNILNTVPFFAQSQTPGVTLVAQSGHDYLVTAVPEPGSGWLVGCGLAFLWGSTRLKGLDRTAFGWIRRNRPNPKPG